MSTHVFQIEQGAFGLSLVDKLAVGYADTWVAPTGKTVSTAVIADYVSGGLGDFTCQVTSGALSASPNTTDQTTPATFCGPEETTTQVGVTSYTVDVSFLQDPDLVLGLNRYLFENDTLEAFFYLGLNGDVAPKVVGRCRLIAGTIGGDARTNLTATLSLPCSGKPDALFGNATDSVPISGAGATAATNATAGVPGSWNGTAPLTVADLIAGVPKTVSASPNTAWTTGQYVQTQAAGTGGRAHWSGTLWVTGAAT